MTTKQMCSKYKIIKASNRYFIQDRDNNKLWAPKFRTFNAAIDYLKGATETYGSEPDNKLIDALKIAGYI